jgi:hypothetical protein
VVRIPQLYRFTAAQYVTDYIRVVELQASAISTSHDCSQIATTPTRPIPKLVAATHEEDRTSAVEQKRIYAEIEVQSRDAAWVLTKETV